MTIARSVALALLIMGPPAFAQDGRFHVAAGKIQQRTNGVSALMGYSQTPDVTSGALSMKNGSTGNPRSTIRLWAEHSQSAKACLDISKVHSVTRVTIRSS